MAPWLTHVLHVQPQALDAIHVCHLAALAKLGGQHTLWGEGRRTLSWAGPSFSPLPPRRGAVHLAGQIPVHTGHSHIGELLQLLSTAFPVTSLVLEVQLLGQRALEVLGARVWW